MAKEIIIYFKHAVLEVSKQNVTYRYDLEILAEQFHVMSQNLKVPLKWRRDTCFQYKTIRSDDTGLT